MISSEDISTIFQHHFKICLLWFLPEKECSFYTHLFWCTEMRWLFISSTAFELPVQILVQLLLELELNLIVQNAIELEFTLYLECRWNDQKRNLKLSAVLGKFWYRLLFQPKFRAGEFQRTTFLVEEADCIRIL